MENWGDQTDRGMWICVHVHACRGVGIYNYVCVRVCMFMDVCIHVGIGV